MIKRTLGLLLITSLCISCTACWNKKEPKELAAVLSIVYDIDEWGKTHIIVELLDTKNQGSQDISRQQSTKIVKLYGDSASEGLRDTTVTIDRTMYGAHNKARIITERLARQGIGDTIDFFMRDHLTDERPINLVVKNDDPLLLFESDIGLPSSLGGYIDQISRARKEFSEYSVFIDTLDFMKDYYREGKQPVLGVIEAIVDDAQIPKDATDVDQDSPKYKIKFNGLAVFKEDKLLGYSDKSATRVYNILVGDIKSAYITIPVGDEYITGNCLKTKSKIKVDMVDEEVKINIKINKEVMLSQNATDYDVGDRVQIKIMEEAINSFIEKEVKEAINIVQTEFQSDIFGFGDKMHKQHPKVWQNIKNEWDNQYFVNAKVKVKVDAKIRFGGEIREKFGKRVYGE